MGEEDVYTKACSVLNIAKVVISCIMYIERRRWLIWIISIDRTLVSQVQVLSNIINYRGIRGETDTSLSKYKRAGEAKKAVKIKSNIHRA